MIKSLGIRNLFAGIAAAILSFGNAAPAHAMFWWPIYTAGVGVTSGAKAEVVYQRSISRLYGYYPDNCYQDTYTRTSNCWVYLKADFWADGVSYFGYSLTKVQVNIHLDPPRVGIPMEILDYSPRSTSITTSSCTTVNVGLNYGPVSAGVTIPLCPSESVGIVDFQPWNGNVGVAWRGNVRAGIHRSAAGSVFWRRRPSPFPPVQGMSATYSATP